MSKGKDNEMWQRIEDAFTPNQEELQRTARELARVRIEHGSQHEGLAATTESQAVEPTPAQPTPWRRVAAVATALALFVPSIAWVGSKYVWPAPLKLHNMEFLEAEQSATASSSDESDWELGLAYMAGRHQSVVEILANLALRADPAGLAAADALKRFGNQAIDALMSDDRQIRAIAEDAIGDGDDEIRVQAVLQLEAFLRAAEEVLARADDSTPKRARAKAVYLKGIEKQRSQVADGTLPQPNEGGPKEPADSTSHESPADPEGRSSEGSAPEESLPRS